MKLDFELAAISCKLKGLAANASKVQLATWAPDAPNLYRANGKRLPEKGYLESIDRPSATQNHYA